MWVFGSRGKNPEKLRLIDLGGFAGAEVGFGGVDELILLEIDIDIGKMVGKPLGWRPLNNPPPKKHLKYHVGIYWGPYPLLKGSNRGVKQLGAGYHPKGTSIFPVKTEAREVFGRLG